MQITELKVAGFRGFAAQETIDLDADAIVIIGANGQGKTSIFDGILWALTGDIPRLPANGTPVSLFSYTGEARVSLKLRDNAGTVVTVNRSSDGERQRIQVQIGEDSEIFQGDEATTRLLGLIWPEALYSSSPIYALSSAITRSVYLQQDRVGDFIERTSDADRFDAVSQLVGIGNITDLQGQLDTARSNWTRASTERTRLLDAAQERVERLAAMVANLDRTIDSESESSEDWTSWWDENRRLGVTISSIPYDSSEAPSAIEATINQLDTLRRTQDRLIDSATDLLSDWEPTTDPGHGVESARELMEAKLQHIDVARESLSTAETQLASERREQVRHRESSEEIRALAQLALRHLGDECPVCLQSYDISTTRSRLEGLAASLDHVVLPSAERVADLADQLEKLEQELTVLEGVYGQANVAAREFQSRLAERSRRLQELGVDDEDAEARGPLEEAINQFIDTSSNLLSQRRTGERLALMLTRTSERARRAELRRQTETSTRELDELQSQVNSRQATYELATKILEGLRTAASDVVRVRLDGIQPIFQRIYSTVDPHPSFRDVRLSSRFFNRRGRIDTLVGDAVKGIDSNDPGSVFSSSQLNALAVSIFLSFNLGVSPLPLDATLLDDPLQSLDDVNLLGLIDLFRKTRQRRQLIVSTHDEGFGDLLVRKLRPVGDDQRTIVVKVAGWSREGPVLDSRDVEKDNATMRIVA